MSGQLYKKKKGNAKKIILKWLRTDFFLSMSGMSLLSAFSTMTYITRKPI